MRQWWRPFPSLLRASCRLGTLPAGPCVWPGVWKLQTLVLLLAKSPPYRWAAWGRGALGYSVSEEQSPECPRSLCSPRLPWWSVPGGHCGQPPPGSSASGGCWVWARVVSWPGWACRWEAAAELVEDESRHAGHWAGTSSTGLGMGCGLEMGAGIGQGPVPHGHPGPSERRKHEERGVWEEPLGSRLTPLKGPCCPERCCPPYWPGARSGSGRVGELK